MASEAFHAVVAFISDALDLDNPDASPEELRAGMSAGDAAFVPPPGVTFEPVTIASGSGSSRSTAPVSALWVRPDGGDPTATLLYFHGGGYVIGSPDTHRNITGRLALALGCPVLSVDYRLAPEHPYPAAVDDAVGAYEFLLDRGVAPERIAVAGDSAGGGLTLALLLALRDAEIPLPAAGAPISPWTDLSLSGASMQTKAEVDPMVTEAGLRRMADWYLAGHDPLDPLASPLFGDLAGLPPLLVHVGDSETLLDDSVRLHERAQAAGVDCTLEVFPEMIHVFHAFVGLFPEADAAVAELAAFVRGHLALPEVTP